MNQFKTYGKATIRITFEEGIPRRFVVYDSNDKIYYFRNLSEKNFKIKFNVAKGDTFYTNVNCKIDVDSYQPTKVNFKLPPPEKHYFHQNFEYKFNPDLKGTPARNFYKSGVIEYSPMFLKLPYPVKVFILCHEIGHSFYHCEMKADLYGLKLYLENGYNKSTALHSLLDVLNLKSEQNKKRIANIYKILNNE
jgi:hypothetical protein